MALSLLEAMSYGNCCLVSDICENTEVVEDKAAAFRKGEADTLICAGMGGKLVISILEQGKKLIGEMKQVILQPQSEIEKFRQFLRENGYGILDEEMIEEEGKFYQVIRASGKDVLSMEPDCGGACGAAGNGKGHCGMEETVDTAEIPVISQGELCKLKDRYGPVLLRKRTPVFLSFLEREAAVYEEILANLRKQGLTEEKRRERYAEVERLLRDNCLAKSVGKVVK